MNFSAWVIIYLTSFYQWMSFYLHQWMTLYLYSRLRSSAPIDATPTAELIEGVRCLEYHPTAELDLVFLSGPKTRWETRDGKECWPLTWVPEAFPLSRVLMIDFPPFKFWEAAINLTNCLVAKQVALGSRPFFLVAHGVGGLLLKELVVRADTSPFRGTGVRSNCKGVVFYDVPHLGGKESEKKAVCMQFGVEESQFEDICSHRCFRLNLDYKPIEHPALYFIGRYKKQWSPESTGLGSEASNVVFVDCGDHFEVCKPTKKTDLTFAMLKEFVQDYMDDADEFQLQDRSKEYVGLEDKVTAVSGLIAKGAAAIAVVSLNGMGGVGKTTLAREVVDHIRKGYEKMAWVEVTAKPNLEELQDKLAKGFSIELHGTDPIQRRNEMRAKLKHRKVLVVLDNVWDAERVPISADDLAGESCLILTTRDEAVARSLKAQVYNLHILDNECSEKLFCSRAGIDYDAQDSEMQELLSRVVERCAGLPLAIEAVAATAARLKRELELEYWTDMLEDWENDMDGVNGALLLSFHKLRPDEQQVFLLLQLLPSSHSGRLLFFLSSVLNWSEHRARNALIRLHQCHLLECHKLAELKSMTVVSACQGSKFDEEGILIHDLLQDVALYVLSGGRPREDGYLWLAKDYKTPDEKVLHVRIDLTFFPQDHQAHKIARLEAQKIVSTPCLRSICIDEQLASCNGMRWFHSSWWSHPSLVVLILECSELSAIPPELFTLTNLRILGLGSNRLSGNIPPQFCTLTNLTYLDLSHNELNGTIPPELSALTNLTFLELSYNQLSGSIPPELSFLTNLTFLDLCDNRQSGNIPPELSALIKLTELDLSYNQLSGSIPRELSTLTNLTFFHLYDNQLNGNIPPELSALTNLTVFNIYNNQLNGSIPPELSALTNLTELNLYNNHLSGNIPPELSALTNLRQLDLSDNQLRGNIPPELSALTNLTFLDLSNNQLSGSIPPELSGLTDLGHLDLSDNQLSGNILPELSALTNLTSLNLCNNRLSGSIPSELSALTNLAFLVLSKNQLSGNIPPELSALTNLSVLKLFNNQISGSIPPELSALTNLSFLELSNNKLSGSIPLQLAALANLKVFALLNNELYGSIPPELSALTSLEVLTLSNNRLTGNIPRELSALTNLEVLTLTDNQLSGDIPPQLSALTNLVVLELSNNQLNGDIPAELSASMYASGVDSSGSDHSD